MRKITKVPQIPVPNMPEPVEIRWRDWSLGQNSEADPRDLPLGASASIDNFDIDSLGKVKDINGYTATLSNYPASLSIQRVFQYKVTKPSSETISIVIGTISGVWKVYAVNTTLFDRDGDSNGWRDLTEYYVATGETGSSGATVVASLSGAGQGSDNQRGYLAINLTDGMSSIITASSYSGGTGFHTLTLSDSINASVSDSFLIQRFPLIGLFQSGSVTDYDISVTDADDISFLLDNEALRINFGSDSNQARGIWFGYIERYLLDGNQNSDQSTPNGYNHSGWTCENQEMQRVSAESWASVISMPTDSDPLPAGDYTLRSSYMYDGNQEGPLMDYNSSVLDFAVTSGHAIGVELFQYLYIEYPASGTAPPMSLRNGADINGYTMFMSHRITDINLYLSNDQVNYYLVDSFLLSADSSTPTLNPTGTQVITGTKWTARGGEYSDRTGFGSYPYIEEDKPTKSMGFCSVQTMVRGRRIVGDMRQPSPEDFEQYVFRIAAAMPHANGTFNNDVFGISLYTHIDIRTKQADKVMGLEELNGGLLALKENSLHFIDFGGGRMDTWTIAVSNEDVGAVSRRGIVRVPNGVIFPAKKNIYIFDGVDTVPIADSWKTEYRALTSKENSIGAYYPEGNQYYLMFPDSDKLYVFSLDSGAWVSQSYFIADNSLYEMTTEPDGGLLTADRGAVYTMNDSTSTVSIQGSILSSIQELDPAWEWKIKKAFLTYTGTSTGTAVTVILYKSHGSSPVATLTFPTSGVVVTNGQRVSDEVDNIRARITTESNSNYNTEIHELMLVAIPVRRRRAAI